MSQIVNIRNLFIYFASVKLRKLFKSRKFMTANEALNNYLSSLPYLVSAQKAKEMQLKFSISEDVVSHWRRGRTKIPPFYRPEISKILGVDIFTDVAN